MKTFEDLNKKIEEFETKIREEGSRLFREITLDIFEKYPEVNSFSWTQYTPYFNDGEECTFSVNEVDEINGFNDYNRYDSDEKENIFKNYHWDSKKSDPRSFEIVSTLKDFISSAPEDVLKSTFGDHSKITVYRDKDIKIERYDHD